MKHYHKLEVQQIVRETANAISIRFNVPDDLRDVFAYKQGQHLGLRKDLNGEDVRRSYSICSSVEDDCLEVAVRQVDGGVFSTFANNELREGDLVDVFPPVGRFNIELDAQKARNYVAFAAGSGITPILSIIKTTLETEPNSTFSLFYGNKNSRSSLFKARISDLKNKFLDRFTFFYFFSQETPDIDLFDGRLEAGKTAEILKKLMPADQIDHAFICGPGSMIDDVAGALEEHGLTKEQIHHEHFVSGTAAKASGAKAPERASQSEQIDVTVIRDGSQHNLTLEKGDVPLLESISDNGIDVPFSCKGGVCCTCRAKVVKGEVEMVLNYGLETDEVDKGFVLTCQSYPVSDKLVLDFDA